MQLLFIVLALLGGPPAWAETASAPQVGPPGMLARGVNLTNWFRFPASTDPAALGRYLPDSAILDIRRAGFGFVRLAVQPEIVAYSAGLSALITAIGRLRHAGLAVIVEPHPARWQLETSASDRAALLGFWHALAPALARFGPESVLPEILNEPVFAGDAEGWARLQALVLAEIRRSLPRHIVILTGNDWGSLNGLLDVSGDAPANTVYSFHFYDPPELTALAAYRPGLDRAALARLPFPLAEPGCGMAAASAGDRATGDLIRYVCALPQDRPSRRFAAAAEWGRRHHAPVLLGEFGASRQLNAPARLAWLRAVRLAAEQQGIGWALWGYDDSMGFDVTRPPGDHPKLNAGVLEALGLTP